MNRIHLNKISLFLVSTLIASFSCTKHEDKKTTQPVQEDEPNVVVLSAAQSKTAGLLLGKIEMKKISGTIKANGILDVPPQQLVSISAPMGGFLKKTVLLQGSRVSKGQNIVTMENLDFIQLQQDYLEAKSQYEFSTADYERQQDLAKENVNSQKVLQQAKSSFQTWQAKYNGLKEKLRVLNINSNEVDQGKIHSTINLYSPIDGYVTQVNANIGKFVNPADVLFEIVDTEHLHAELIVFEKDVRKLRIGQKVRFTLANETEERMATVYLIGREISTDRTIRIHCHIDTEDKELLPGMYLMAVVETGGASVPALQNEAIIDYQGKKYLFVLTPKKDSSQVAGRDNDRASFEMMEISVGNSELGYTEVVLPDGFSPDNAIVIRGAYSLLSKLKNSEAAELPD